MNNVYITSSNKTYRPDLKHLKTLVQFYHEELAKDEVYITIAEAEQWLFQELIDAVDSTHTGDCTSEAHPCKLCAILTTMENYEIYCREESKKANDTFSQKLNS